MTPTTPAPTSHDPNLKLFITRDGFSSLFEVLESQGYQVIGPTVDQEAIVYNRISSVNELPKGWTDEQSPGSYRLVRRDDNALFGYVVGPHSWKRFLFPPVSTLSVANQTESGWVFEDPEIEDVKYAFLGVRACELAAMRIQDRIFLPGPYMDPVYHERRNDALIIAVNCTQAASTCFCTSMGTGPRCASGFDMAITEITDGFLAEAATSKGQNLAEALGARPAEISELQDARSRQQQAVQQIERSLDTTDIRNLLLSNLDHQQWDDVAARCISCTNCTMVCPTCFCNSVEEVNDLRDEGQHIERRRVWDSCFNPDFSYMNGGLVRDNIRSRYRQWLTHKLASWIDQFGTSGCVGCGRCITWCPVGIDLTEEVAAIRAGQGTQPEAAAVAEEDQS